MNFFLVNNKENLQVLGILFPSYSFYISLSLYPFYLSLWSLCFSIVNGILLDQDLMTSIISSRSLNLTSLKSNTLSRGVLVFFVSSATRFNKVGKIESMYRCVFSLISAFPKTSKYSSTLSLKLNEVVCTIWRSSNHLHMTSFYFSFT